MALTECRPSSVTIDGAYPTVVSLRGEHDAETAPALWNTLAGAVTLDDAALVVDLRDVSFMDAATIGVIIRTRNLLHLHSRSLIIRAPSSCARRVLVLCGLSHLLDQRLSAVEASAR